MEAFLLADERRTTVTLTPRAAFPTDPEPEHTVLLTVSHGVTVQDIDVYIWHPLVVLCRQRCGGDVEVLPCVLRLGDEGRRADLRVLRSLQQTLTQLGTVLVHHVAQRTDQVTPGRPSCTGVEG